MTGNRKTSTCRAPRVLEVSKSTAPTRDVFAKLRIVVGGSILWSPWTCGTRASKKQLFDRNKQLGTYQAREFRPFCPLHLISVHFAVPATPLAPTPSISSSLHYQVRASDIASQHGSCDMLATRRGMVDGEEVGEHLSFDAVAVKWARCGSSQCGRSPATKFVTTLVPHLHSAAVLSSVKEKNVACKFE